MSRIRSSALPTSLCFKPLLLIVISILGSYSSLVTPVHRELHTSHCASEYTSNSTQVQRPVCVCVWVRWILCQSADSDTQPDSLLLVVNRARHTVAVVHSDAYPVKASMATHAKAARRGTYPLALYHRTPAGENPETLSIASIAVQN